MLIRGNQGSPVRKSIILFAALFLTVSVGMAVWFYMFEGDRSVSDGQFVEVKTTPNIQSEYDVIVVGTDPEGVAAAVAASRNGLKTLLIDGHDRPILGGLMTMGWLNSLDHNYDREKKAFLNQDILNKGIFSEWYELVEGDSFQIHTAANAFYQLVKKEPNIDVVLGAKEMKPIVENSVKDLAVIKGLDVITEAGKSVQVTAKAVIDATQDADIAAAVGVPFTIGREDIGNKQARMAVTAVFRMKNVTPEVWKQVQKRLKDDGDPHTDANEFSAWGYGEMQKYPSVNKERVKMRGLNIGRQKDSDTMLINALQIFGIDGLEPKSRQEAFEIARNELPHVVKHMKEIYPEFANTELDAVAPELYVRETRHIQGEYRLTMMDVLENRDQWDRIAFGSYPVDIQRISPTDNGAVMSHPIKYAVPFRSIVPLKVDGLLVVGRSASFDTLPHGSARVIPVGMATAQAAGTAVKVALENNLSFRQLAQSQVNIAKLQERLNAQGMELKPFEIMPALYMTHKSYEGLKAVVSLGLVIGGYDNSGFALDPESNVKRMENLLHGVRKAYVNKLSGDPAAAVAGLKEPEKLPLAIDQAAYIIAKTVGLAVSKEQALNELLSQGILKKATIDGIGNPQKMNNGDSYMLIKDVVEFAKK